MAMSIATHPVSGVSGIIRFRNECAPDSSPRPEDPAPPGLPVTILPDDIPD